MYCFKNNYRKGSLSIELSLIMPGVMAVILIIIFSGYYYHDRCVIQRCAYSSVLKTSYDENIAECNLNSEEELERAIIYYFDKEIDGRLIGKWNLEKCTSVDNEKIEINVSGSMICIEGIFTGYLSGMMFEINLTESAMRKWKGI